MKLGLNSKQQGVTLLELMMVLAIVAILAAIAIPSYSQYVLRSHRVDARNILQTISQKIEQNYKITRSYNTLATDVGGSRAFSSATLSTWGLDKSPVGSSAVRYEIEVVSADPAGYVLRAKAVNAQVGDKRCANFYLTQSGEKSATELGSTAPANSRSDVSTECWSK